MATQTKSTAWDSLMESEAASSPELFLDLSDVSDSVSFEPWPAGVYAATVEECEFAISSNSGNQMWKYTFRATHPETDKTRRFFLYTVINEGGLPRFKRTIKVLQPEYDIAHVHIKESPVDMIGSECRIKLNVTTHNGERRNEVKDVLPAETDQFTL